MHVKILHVKKVMIESKKINVVRSDKHAKKTELWNLSKVLVKISFQMLFKI